MNNNHNLNKICVLSRAVVIDQGHMLLCKTCDLPVNFYFLPGGHIEHGETAQGAVLRELEEEAGVTKCTIKRFLGCLEYSFEPKHSSICHNHEYNFIFEVESDGLKIANHIHKREAHIELLWMHLDQLSSLDFRPEPFKKLIPKWRESTLPNPFESVMI